MRAVEIITRSDAIGGAYVHVRDLSQALVRDGHEVTVLVGGGGSYTSEFESRGIPFRPIPSLIRSIRPWIDARGYSEIKAALRELKPDIVATHSSKAGLLGRMAAHKLGIPATFTAHGWAFAEGVPERSRKMYAAIERFAARYCQRIINVSEADRRLALQFGIADDTKLVAVHNGMPDNAPELRANPLAEPPTIIMVARFEAQKDQPTLIRALATLKDLPWRVELIGGGPLQPGSESLAAELGIADRIDFLGARSDVPERLAASQIFVLISHWEGFPLSTIEAMRAGLPVVVSDVGGVAEAVVEGETGHVVPRQDVTAVASALRSLLSDPGKRAAMGSAGRTLYEREFTFETMYQRTLEVYRQAMNR